MTATTVPRHGDMTPAELRAQIRRLAALENPATMGMYLDPRYRIRAHTRLIAGELAQLGPERDRLLVMLPPQVGKTELVSRLLPFWWLARHPRDRIAIASYAGALAIKSAAKVRDYVAEHGHEFGLTLRRGAATAYDWSLTTGGGIRAVGALGGLTGHAVTGIGICDDPVKDRAEAESALMRERIWDWWSSVFLSRLRPGTPVVLCMTRWHPSDLAGRVLDHEGSTDEGGRWRVINLPAFAEGDDLLGRAAGEPLTHPAIADDDQETQAAHWNDKRATSTPRDWLALYMGKPRPPEGALISAALLRERRDPRPTAKPVKAAVAVDPSGGGRDTAGIVGGWLGDDQRLYISHDWSGVMPSDQWARKACLLAHELDADRIDVEGNFGGDIGKLVIRTAWDKLANEGKVDGLPPLVRRATGRQSKRLRAEPIAQQFAEDRIRLATFLPELEGEWTSWVETDSESPGRIDASVYLAYALLPVPGQTTVVSSPAGISREQLTGRTGTAGIPIRRR